MSCFPQVVVREPVVAPAGAAAQGRVGRGSVALVGAGPGDPELLTLKALRALENADVIVVDRLVGPAILDLARPAARRIHVGKLPYQVGAGSDNGARQQDINAILVREALAGNRVVRLKGGDPFVFGRAVEEIEALEAAGIAVTIVPGVTAALAAAASARLALTERGKRRAFTILTGQASDGPAGHDWATLAKGGQSLAIYMGVAAGPSIARRLLAAGLDAATPVTVVENASLGNERVHGCGIAALPDLLRTACIQGPAMLFVGVAPLPQPAAIPAAAGLAVDDQLEEAA
ncbi:MAG: uroporphyrinogen-III C-methyltransferase [Geminicoccaceae bacterium]